MMTSSSVQKRHSLPSTIETLARVESIIEDLKDAYGIPEEIYGNILVSITEAVNNAIKHGNKYDKEKAVDFEFDHGEKEYVFIVRDEGIGFDFDNVPDPTHPDNIEKMDGRGIFIMKNLSDGVEFDQMGKEVRISFNRI